MKKILGHILSGSLSEGIKMYKLFLASILFVSSCLGMNQQEDLSMIEITKAEAMCQFAGQIIAFQTDAAYFEPSGNYTLDNNNLIYFARVSLLQNVYCNRAPTLEMGHDLSRVIKKEANGSFCVLIDSTLSRGFSARLATPEEVEKIFDAIKNKEAEWN